jgi:apolipoprotein N-acyltransferase
LYSEVKKIAEKAQAYLLLGSSSHQKFKAGMGKTIKYRNSAFLINPHNPDVHQQYDKIHLLPFGEYVPKSRTIPWNWINVPNLSSYLPGKEYTVFGIPNFRFSVTICWESIFPRLVRQFVKRGAQCIVNLTNEAWFGKTAAAYHFLAASVFRAVENRVYVVRCGNTGVSCIIDPCGRIVDRVQNESRMDLFVRGYLTNTVIPMDSKTVYTRYGDWFIWLSLVFTVSILVIAFLKRLN